MTDFSGLIDAWLAALGRGEAQQVSRDQERVLSALLSVDRGRLLQGLRRLWPFMRHIEPEDA